MAGYPRRARLLRPADFKRVITQGRRRRYPGFTAYEQPGSGVVARLGLAVSRKALPRAVDRNRFKRKVRESFRTATALPKLDVVIMATANLRGMDAQTLTAELNEYWRQLPDRWQAY